MKIRFLALSLAVVLITSFTACSPKKGEDADPNKTTLYVGYYNGGIGETWLKNAIEKFEEKYKDTSLEEGKKGVQVLIGNSDTTSMAGETLKKTVANSRNEVFFTEEVFYYNWVSKNLMYDLTQAVDEKLSDFDEDVSVGDKMDQSIKEALTMNGKIYAVPFWEGYYGMVYNATLFNENNWFYAKNGSFTNASGDLSTGPDGKQGTYDDGMPATYDEFFTLLEKINKANITPIQWAGGNADYFAWLISALFADYEGVDNFMLNYTFNGTAELVKSDSIDADKLTYQTEQVQINQNNGYELSRQAGLLQAFHFAQKLLRGNGYYDANLCLSGSFKQKDAQLAFVRNTSTTSQKPVAILIDGSWWENEASASFAETYGTNATKYDSEMEYKWMPLPKATKEKVGSGSMMVSPLESYCFINSNIAQNKVKAAEKFIQFCHTNKMMATFTETTGIKKPYKYSVDKSKLTTFGKSLIEASDDSAVAFPKSNNILYTYDPLNFRLVNLLTSRYDTKEQYSVIPTAPLTIKSGTNYKYNYEDVFKGVYSYRKDILWPTFGSVLNQ